MGGVDKAALDLAGVTLLERALAATMSAVEVVVVGHQVPTSRPVTWTLEDPPSGGPAAGLLAALDSFLVRPDLVAVLAVDMPKVNAGTIARLTWAVEDDPAVDGALLVDPDGRRQPLAAVYRFTALAEARPDSLEEQHGLPVRRLVGLLRMAEVPTVGDEARDVDTWADVRDLRAPYA
jgi:molybdopterin-guanine dinucleotide biosynthesis protein A